jgi:two-component system, chemotaxis family, protein-glutamate methylesterase/glutaminase
LVRVLLVEDSAVTREYLGFLLARDPEIQVVGAASDGLDAVEQVERLRPEVILMDIRMPRMSGLEATRKIMSCFPTPIVLVTAGFSSDDTALCFEAIKAGALTLLNKPSGFDNPEALNLARTVKLMAEVKVVRRWPPSERSATRPLVKRDGRRIRVLAIGASTGGPAALVEVLGDLRGALAVPVLVVQHITPGFAAGLAEWLSKETRLAVKLAENGEPARPGVVYLAPNGVQMAIGADERIRLTRENTVGALHPTVDHLFASVAEVYGRFAMGILLTGMGRDGADGLSRLRGTGAVTIAQDEATSVVFGMPGEAVRLGAAERVLPPREIGQVIRSLTDQNAKSGA